VVTVLDAAGERSGRDVPVSATRLLFGERIDVVETPRACLSQAERCAGE